MMLHGFCFLFVSREVIARSGAGKFCNLRRILGPAPLPSIDYANSGFNFVFILVLVGSFEGTEMRIPRLSAASLCLL